MTSCGEPPEKQLQNEQFLAKHLVDSLKIPKSELSLFVNKSDFVLSIVHKKDTIKQYAVVLGYDPIGDKQMEGDMRTPEGVFKIRDLYPHASWSKFIWIDYPNEESYRKFEKGKAEGSIPEEATIGGEVGIHGVSEGEDDMVRNGENWTFGCVSLETADINDLYSVCFVGMKIEIEY